MSDLLLFNSAFYIWFVLPLLIFIARVADVSMGTVRVIFIARGLKYLAPIVGFFEILIWLLAIGQIMQNLSNPLCYIAYAGGFATGNYVGIWIAEKLSLGMVLIRVITSKDASELLQYLKSAEYGVTSVDAQGSAGKVQVVFTIVRRREVASVVNLIKQFNPKAFYTIEEVGFVEEGIFPTRKNWLSSGFKGVLRPWRKGK
ncbi:MAG TPA: DUF2179 domain-containing protein [Sedimentisphaerales bacterium]|nr:DUF2179 domain-containing protein [Sedimentisphaerales bacterium]